jgi:hypothetical protein
MSNGMKADNEKQNTLAAFLAFIMNGNEPKYVEDRLALQSRSLKMES